MVAVAAVGQAAFTEGQFGAAAHEAAVTIDIVVQQGSRASDREFPHQIGGGSLSAAAQISRGIGYFHECRNCITRDGLATVIKRCNVILITAIGETAVTVALAGALPDKYVIPVDGVAEHCPGSGSRSIPSEIDGIRGNCSLQILRGIWYLHIQRDGIGRR